MTACDQALACVHTCRDYAKGKIQGCVYDKYNSEPSSMVEAECNGQFQNLLFYCAQTCVQKYGKC